MSITNVINYAKKLAKKSNLKYYWHGCIIVMNGKIISCGFNRIFNNRRIHAEADAVSKLNCLPNKILHRCELYVIKIPSDLSDYRINANNILRNSKPCDRCRQIIINKRINRVYYSIDS